jgi:signal transduction histidine kinase
MSTLFACPHSRISRVFPSTVNAFPQTRILNTFRSALIVGASYYAGTLVGFAWTPNGQPNSTFWPPNAILLACLLLAPTGIWWTLILAVFPAHMLAQHQAGVPLWTAVGWFTSNISEALISAFFITRLTDRRKIFDDLRGVFTFLIFAVVISPFATSFLDAFAVVITGWGRNYWPLGIERFFTNALAVLTIVPTIMLFSVNGVSWIRRLTVARLYEVALVGGGTVLTSMVLFGFHGFSAATTPALLYAPLPLLLWATVRYGSGGLSFAVLVIALISTWYVMHGREPFPHTSMAQNTLSLQVLFCGVDVPLMFLSAVLADGRRTRASLRLVSGKLIKAQERERASIARDLDDDIAQRLALVAAEIQQFQSEAPRSFGELRTRTDKLHEDLVHISDIVHTLSHELHDARLTYVGLVATSRGLCREVSERHNIEVDFKHDSFDSVPCEASLCVFRVLQESLHNTVRHSGALRVEVQLRKTGDQIHLIVSDTGKGFDPNGAVKGAGLGLTNMQELLKLVNGELLIASEPQRGTTIHARVPFTSEKGSASIAS